MAPSYSRIVRGIRNPIEAAYVSSTLVRRQLLATRYDSSGVSILDEDWDTLVLLDACRFDVFSEVNYIDGNLEKKWSRGSGTSTFLQRNFQDRTAHDTVYLSANPKAGKHRDAIDVFKLVGIWGTDTNSETHGQTNPDSLMEPEPVVQRALDLHDEYPNKRHIVHLMPPHVPHVWKDGERLPDDSPYRTYEAARKGDVHLEEMRTVYRENLTEALEAVEPLVEFVSGKVVISSDHGELLGEGIPTVSRFLHSRWDQPEKYDFGHYDGLNVPSLREIPWLETDHSVRRSTMSGDPEPPDIETDSIEHHLETLGYR